MFIQRIRSSEVPTIAFYFILMRCEYFEREELLDERETNLLSYLRGVSDFHVSFFHSNKDIRRTAKKVAQEGIDEIFILTSDGNYIDMRIKLRDTLISYFRLTFGSDFIDLIETEISFIVGMMKEKSYLEFTKNEAMIWFIENKIEVFIREAERQSLIRTG